MPYKILINEYYFNWNLYEEQTMTLVEQPAINPLEQKIFTGDILNIKYKTIKSPIREAKNIPGILVLNGKTYGRGKSGIGKFYYKCIPNDKCLPPFLVTYEQKQIGFNKNVANRYILFKYCEWIDKHPICTITNMIGDVEDLTAFYEYQLNCKNLFISLKEFTKSVNNVLKQNANTDIISEVIKKYKIDNRLDHSIITIDPQGSLDLDDAISIRGNILSVYIANVPLLIECLNLWTAFSQRVSTVYLPDRKYTMLPPILSDNLCSLLENENRLTFCMDIIYNDGKIDIQFCNAFSKS